ncbi:acetate kinase [Mycoplasmoides fastidiosum]|uniref:Acetate kinase n=1 Tax=Mycoplasmoides fastidiosum TaxID=92758 RepID=A0ABU0LYE8_9BACT|nr:acetate kinase [Mycoplasmoides fastidiosum]MDQ0513714.1 acetate kinase [Mycoplasmoides fastidiosum]UUD37863.1 acetate kinase [Mycoplasmoides fastidiosum]
MNKQILIINAGSSSIKYSLYSLEQNAPLAEGICERIGIDGSFSIKYNGQKEEAKADFSNHEKALKFLFSFLENKKILENRNSIVGVGHRIVQGGNYFKDSTLLETKEIAKIKEYIPLAPLHNEPEVLIVEEMQKLLPHAGNVGVFDTSFHQTLTDENKTYAINHQLAQDLKIQRYGFHGTSYKFITEKMRAILNKDKVNIIVAHLGNGASITAIRENLSINTSMGLTPLEGLVMGTRSGDIDPGIFNYLSQQLKLDPQKIDTLLNKESGLFGISGTADMRDVIAGSKAGKPLSTLALNLFCKRVANYIVMYANDLAGKVDAIVFTAGIGENAFPVRALVCEKTPLLGLEIDPIKNEGSVGAFQVISSENSKIPVYVVRTNEELMIFNDVKRILKLA